MFTSEQVAGLLTIKAGDAYGMDTLRRSMDDIENAYSSQGYVDVRIDRFEKPTPTSPRST